MNSVVQGGYLAGLWHDLGKYADKFQEMIRSAAGIDAHVEKRRKVDHSTVGALFAIQKYGKKGWPLAFVMAGHHAGLADKTDLGARFEAKARLFEKNLIGKIPEEILTENLPSPPMLSPGDKVKDKGQISRSQEFWIRMLYSALVDADFLNTEKFHDQGEGGEKILNRAIGECLSEIKRKFDLYYLNRFSSKTKVDDPDSVNKIRHEVMQACREKALSSQGVFSLSAPTGSGKTLAAMAFALNHASHHSLRRSNRSRAVIFLRCNYDKVIKCLQTGFKY